MISRRSAFRQNRGRIPSGAGASVPFDPSQIPNLVLDLNGDLGITLNGAFVSAWADQSGNGNHFTQATPGVQPNRSAADANVNNHGTVICDVTDNQLVCANSITVAWVAAVAYYPGITFTGFDGLFNQVVTTLLRGSMGSADWRTADIAANRWRDGVLTPTALDVANRAHLYEIEPTGGPLTANTWRVGRDANNVNRQWRGGVTRILAASTMPSAGVRAQLLTYSQGLYLTP